MRISQKTEYAVRALLDLVIQNEVGKDQPVRSQDIARRQNIPSKYLEMILVELRRGGLLRSRRGPVGGHQLTRGAKEISIGDVWRAMEGNLTSAPRQVVKNGTDGNPASKCFAEVWDKVDQAVTDVVDNVSLAQLRKRMEEHKPPVDFSI